MLMSCLSQEDSLLTRSSAGRGSTVLLAAPISSGVSIWLNWESGGRECVLVQTPQTLAILTEL